MAFASWWYKTHVSEKTSESPSKPGEKKGSDEKKAASLGSSQSSRTYAGGTASATKALGVLLCHLGWSAVVQSRATAAFMSRLKWSSHLSLLRAWDHRCQLPLVQPASLPV
ncbi:calpastatin [Homo sapiens]|uniref:Calpastatin n=1 Tax=Homo sapiens TaxID=9606 RepID=A0A6Q8PG40_HUMAN|nr:calpastatin [Homo sapiens]KAI4022084.1 calpastatin [Homo sapiens]